MGKFWGSTENVEYRCTTTNLPLCNDTIIVLKITLLHSVSVITNFVIPKRDKQTKTQTNKTSHFFVYSRRATYDPHHTWHGDRGGPCHLCTPPPEIWHPHQISCLSGQRVAPAGRKTYFWTTQWKQYRHDCASHRPAGDNTLLIYSLWINKQSLTHFKHHYWLLL